MGDSTTITEPLVQTLGPEPWLVELTIKASFPPKSIRLGVGTWSGGRHPDNAFVINEPGISRKHAQLDVQVGQVLITDLGSGNGTFVDGQKVEAATSIYDGSEVSFAATHMHVRFNMEHMRGAGKPLLHVGKPGEDTLGKAIVTPKNLPPFEVGLSAGTFTIGRQNGCDIVVLKSDVSRTHCVIEISADGIVVSDQNSSNGTFLGEQQLQTPTTVPWGTAIRVGDNEITFEPYEATPPPGPVPVAAEPSLTEAAGPPEGMLDDALAAAPAPEVHEEEDVAGMGGLADLDDEPAGAADEDDLWSALEEEPADGADADAESSADADEAEPAPEAPAAAEAEQPDVAAKAETEAEAEAEEAPTDLGTETAPTTEEPLAEEPVAEEEEALVPPSDPDVLAEDSAVSPFESEAAEDAEDETDNDLEAAFLEITQSGAKRPKELEEAETPAEVEAETGNAADETRDGEAPEATNDADAKVAPEDAPPFAPESLDEDASEEATAAYEEPEASAAPEPEADEEAAAKPSGFGPEIITADFEIPGEGGTAEQTLEPLPHLPSLEEEPEEATNIMQLEDVSDVLKHGVLGTPSSKDVSDDEAPSAADAEDASAAVAGEAPEVPDEAAAPQAAALAEDLKEGVMKSETSSGSSTLIWILVGVLVLLLLGGGVVAYLLMNRTASEPQVVQVVPTTPQPVQEVKPPPPPPPPKTREVVGQGALQPAQSVVFSYGTKGWVEKVMVTKGQQVAANQELAFVRNREIQDAWMSAAFWHEYYKGKANDFPEAAAQAQKTYEEAYLAYKQLRLVAPFAGVITELKTYTNTPAKEGAHALTLVSLEKMSADVMVSAADAGKMSMDTPVRLRSERLLKNFEGKVTNVGTTPDASGMVPVTVEIKIDAPGSVPNGEAVQATFTVLESQPTPTPKPAPKPGMPTTPSPGAPPPGTGTPTPVP